MKLIAEREEMSDNDIIVKTLSHINPHAIPVELKYVDNSKEDSY